MVTRTAQGHLTITRQRNGKDGSNGTSVLAQYSTNGSSWHTSFQSGDQYMRTSSDNGKTWTSAIKIVGESGTNGSYIEYSFGISAQTETTNVTTAPSISGSWSDAPLSVTTSFPYLWYRMISVDKDGKKGTARYVRITGATGNGVEKVVREYYKSTSATTLSGGSWSEDVPTWENGKYIWERDHIYYTNGTDEYTDPWNATGQKGDTGNTGTSVLAQYSTNGSSWHTSFQSGDQYMRTSSDNGKTWTSAIKIVGESGTNGSYIEYSFGISAQTETTNVTTAPSISGSWSDAPLSVTTSFPYLWYRMISVDKDGKKGTARYVRITGATGQKGDTGNTGTSVTQISTFYVATTKQSGVTRSNTSGWTTSFQEPTADKPYVWRYIRTYLDNGTYQYSDTELVAVFQTGANPNLLDDTAFESDYGLEAWTRRSLYSFKTGESGTENKGSVNSSGVFGLNSFYDYLTYNGNKINYKDVLEQILFKTDGSVKKLEASTQYTLSFWLRGSVGDISIYQTSSSYGFATKELYLQANVTYSFGVSGKINSQAKSDGKTLRTYVYHENWGDGGSAYVDIDTTSSVLKMFSFTPKVTGRYYMTSYLYDSSDPRTGTATVNFYRVDYANYLLSYVYPSAIDTSKAYIVDGVTQSSVGSGGVVAWSPTSAWKRHTVTFTTKSSLTGAEEQKLLFRLLPAIMDGQKLDVWICAPKLERGMIATAYTDSSKSLRGAQIRVTEFESGKQYLAGKLGETYLDVVYSNGSVFNCIKSYISSSTLPENDTEHWKQGDQRELVATKVLLAQNARIDVLSGNQITVYDQDGNVTGGMQGNPTLPIFWAGSDTPKDGMWQQSIDGTAIYGDPDGERIELNPAEKAIKFFNSSNKFVTEHSARSYGVLSSILPSGGSITLKKAGSIYYMSQSDIWYGQIGTIRDEISDLFKPTSNGIMIVNMTRLTLTQTTASSIQSTARPTSQIKVIVRAFTDSAGTNKAYDQVIASLGLVGACDGSSYYQSSNITQGSVTVSTSYYYQIIVELSYFGGGTANKTNVSGSYNITNALISADFYSSMFFGNGLVLSKSPDEYFAAMLEQGSHIRIAMSNAKSGIDLSYAEGLKMKRGSYWHKQPITLLALKVTISSSQVSLSTNLTGVSFAMNTNSPTATTGAMIRSAEGRCTIFFPTNWTTYGLASNGIAQATALRASGNGLWARIYSITNTYLVVETADDGTGNDGTFFVELKV